MELDDFKKIKKIGEGTYGVVFKAQNKKTGRFVALKKVRTDSEDEGITLQSIREISILTELKHPNIVELKNVIIEDSVYLIFEYLSMDLHTYLMMFDSGQCMDQEDVKSYLCQITSAILYCHEKRVLHRDLKPQNLLISHNKKIIKVADFGLGRAFGVPMKVFSHEVGSLWYRAPEILLGVRHYGCPIDIWSIGCIFAQMSTSKVLFYDDTEIGQLLKIFRVLRTPTEEIWPGVTALPDYTTTFPNWTEDILKNQVQNMPIEGVDLLRKMLIYNPEKRINARDVLRHQYFNSLEIRVIKSS